MSLDHLNIGEKAIVKDLSFLNAALKRRLIDLGITEGCEICLKRVMPFGGPCMIEAHGQLVSIRRKEIACIKVLS